MVHVASSSMEAHALRGRLESEDIPVFVKGEHDGPYRMAYGPVLMYVPADLEVQARLVLAQALSGGLSVSEDDDLIADTDWTQAESEPSE
jgi:hypothetical protein